MSLRRDSFYLLTLNAVNLVVGMVASIIVARYLGPEGKGIIYLILMVPLYVSSTGGLAIRAGATYFIGRGDAEKPLVRRIFVIGLGLSVIYLGAGWLLRDLLAETVLKGLDPPWLLLSLLLIPIYIFWSYCDGVLHGQVRFGLYTVIQCLSALLKVGLLLLLVVGLKKGLTAGVVAYVTSAAVPGLLAIAVVWFGTRDEGPHTRTGELFRYSLDVYWGTVAARANLRLDVFLLNPYAGPVAVGIYSVATMLGELVWQVPSAVSQVLFPRVARASKEEAGHMTAGLCRLVVLFAVVAAGGLALVGGWLIRLAFGPEFDAALPALWALLPGVVALSVGMLLARYLMGTGHPRMNSASALIALAVNIPALFLLVPPLGAVGAGLATSITYVLQTLLVVVFFKRTSGIGVIEALVPRPSDLALMRTTVRELVRAVRGMGRAS